MGSGISPAPDEPTAGEDHSCLWSDGARPCPPACPGPSGVTLARCATSAPSSRPPSHQCQFHFLSVLIRLAMTFHLGGLTIKKLRFWRRGSRWLFGRGSLVQRGPCAIRNLPPPTLPDSTVPRGPAELRGPRKGCTSPGRLRTFLPTIRDGSLGSPRSGLARRQGVREAARAQVVFAKCLRNRPGIVPASRTGSRRLPPSPGVSAGRLLSLSPRVSAPGPFCSADRPTREASLPQSHTSLTPRPSGSALPALALRVTPPTAV